MVRMKKCEQTITPVDEGISDRRTIEISYHRNMNLRLVLIAVPVFLLFALFYYMRDNYLQAGLFVTLMLNALVSQRIALKTADGKKLILIKRVGATIAFALLAVSIVTGVLTSDIYISYPWLFFYPVTAALFFGGRIGVVCAASFSAVMAFTIFGIHFPAWTETFTKVFKFHSLLTMLSILVVAVISERARVRMRNHLLEARNQYKAAEARQRHTNAELKSEIDMRLESEKALAESETRYRALFEESSVSMWEENWSRVRVAIEALPAEARDDLEAFLRANPQEIRRLFTAIRLTQANRAALNLCEARSLEHLLKNIWAILPADIEEYMLQRLVAVHRNVRYNGQVNAQTLTGRKLHLLVSGTVPAGYEQSWEKIFSSVYDITERVAVEEEKKRVDLQLQHTRQIQAVASLAGGIAHQFNNALAVIMGNLDLMELDPQGSGTGNRFISGLRASTERMRGLTEQLLAYARGGKYQPRDFSLNALILNLLKTSKLGRNPGIKIVPHFDGDVCLTSGDSTQIKSVLEAVLANAIEAMPGGGEVIIATCYQMLAQGPKGPDGTLPPGRYASISIEDQGVGMDEETRQRIFEPFFSTKFVGRGLSMAAAYGIVRNHDGMIEVHSRLKEGTQVRIYLPGKPIPTTNPVEDPFQKAA